MKSSPPYLWIGILALVASILSGCATARFDTSIDPYGVEDPAARDELALKARKMPWGQEYDITTQVGGTLPEGLVWEAGTHELLSPQDEWVVVARITSQHIDGVTQFGKSLFRNPDFHDDVGGFRRAACSAQLPFKAPAGALWSALPFNWLCFTRGPKGEENYRIHLQELRRNAAVFDADAIFIQRPGEAPLDPALFDDQRVVGFAVKRRARVLQ